VLSENQTGLCKARGNIGGEIKCLNYGRITSIALDPIEKKPLEHFYKGGKILSVGSFGCNMRCGFCQNHRISVFGSEPASVYLSPDELAEKAQECVPAGNIGVAYTYNEPLVGFEYVLDCAKAVRGKGLKNVLVTNGLINAEPLAELLPFIDAMNIDLKSFSDSFYKKHRGELETVKSTIRTANEACHVEVTTLIVPGENDSREEIEAMVVWLASVNKNMPLHISRFFPNHEYDIPATDVGKIYNLAEIARKYLSRVYTGNC